MILNNACYAEYGPIDGQPVFIFHGSPGSRLEQPADLSFCQLANARLIVVERPGFGVSKFKPHRTLLDWPKDIASLADHLGIDRFSILGFSGGGPYAMACAFKLAHRIRRIALVASAAPFFSPEVRAAMPPDNLALFDLAAEDHQQAAAQLAQIIHDADSLLNFFDALASAPDKLTLANRDIRKMYRANLAEALKQGLCGTAYDMGLIAGSWGFKPSDIKVAVQLWHGEEDTTIPIAIGRYLNSVISECSAQFLPDAGHWIMFSHYHRIISHLLKPSTSGT